jgi:molybdopterin molybdotransferase
VTLSRDASGDYVATSTGTQSSGVLLSMAVADGLLVVPSTCEGFDEGDVATVQLLDGMTYQDEAGFEQRR